MTDGPDLITRAIDTLASGHDLDLDDAAAVLSEIMAGNASEVQIAGFLVALRTKGETSRNWPAWPGRCETWLRT